MISPAHCLLLVCENWYTFGESAPQTRTLFRRRAARKMDSCFPPLAALSLKDSAPARAASKGSKSSAADLIAAADLNELHKFAKIEILQDLDLYYIRQIAHKLKVNIRDVWCCWSKVFFRTHDTRQSRNIVRARREFATLSDTDLGKNFKDHKFLEPGHFNLGREKISVSLKVISTNGAVEI